MGMTLIHKCTKQ